MVRTIERTESATTGWSAKHGIGGGMVAGIVFAVAEMLGARIFQGESVLMPLASIASVVIGQPPPQIVEGYSTVEFILIGLGTHMFLAALFGVVFATGAAAVRGLQATRALVVGASVYGLALWLFNFYLIAPLIGRPWFTETVPWQQFVYHTFFFGTVLGIYLAITRPSRG